MATGTISVDRLIQQIEFKIKDARRVQSQMAQVDKSVKNIDQNLKKANDGLANLNKNLLQFGLSALFGGMALKRLGTGIMKSLVETYMKATDEQNIFFQKLQSVQAAFEFLKFSIFDALSQSELVINLIDGFINLINWVSEFVNKHPLIARLFVAFAIGGIILGGILMVIGQLGLGFLGVLSAMELFGPVFAVFGGFFKTLFTFIKLSLLPVLKNIGIAIWNAMILAGRAIWVLLSNPLTWLIAGLVLVMVAIFKLKDAVGGWGEFFKAVLRGAARAGLAFRNFVVDKIISVLLDMVHLAMRFAGAVGATKLFNALVKIESGLNKIVNANRELTELQVERIKELLPQKRTEEKINAALLADFEAFKAAIGLGGGDLQEIKLENTQNNEININAAGADPTVLEEQFRSVMIDINTSFLEDQISRLNGVTRGA